MGTARPVQASEALEQALAQIAASAVAAHPKVALPLDAFLPYLAERAIGDTEIHALASLRAPDLYLACGCLRGDDVATRTLDALLTEACRQVLFKQRASGDTVEEVSQVVRERLLVGSAQKPPALQSYAGRGSLKAWIRAIAVRTHLNAIRGEKEIPEEDDQVFDRLTDHKDPEIAHMRALYKDTFKSAFYRAIDTLDAKDKNLLKFFYIDGLNLEDVAQLKGISRATAHRWLARARAKVADATQRALQEALGGSDASLGSVRRLVLSDLDITLRKLFPDSEP